ncbi:MAG: hypothetical protein IT267_07150 [Saprospiraceae bacterium]|nr:hypothetical protein [Saprospiraceae bacterium]
MKKNSNTKSSVYVFLKSNGVLENGSPDDIQKVRKEYWREYKRKWRKMKRKSEQEFTITFSADDLKDISLEAKRHKLSRTKFIKRACLAYVNNSFIVPDLKEVRIISQMISMTYNSIQELIEKDTIDFKTGKAIQESIHNLEREILPKLHHPESLEEILKEQIQNKPKLKSRLLEFIESL